MFTVTHSRSSWGLEVVYLPVLEGSRFPSARSPWSLESSAIRLGGSPDAITLVDDPLLAPGVSEHSLGARGRWTTGQTDFYAVAYLGVDRLPILTLTDNCGGQPDCFPSEFVARATYLPLRLIGIEVQSALSSVLLKVESTYRDQRVDDDAFRGQVTAIAETSFQLVAGIEYLWQEIAGTGGDLNLILEFLYDDARTENSFLVLRPFQRDLAASITWSLNDLGGTVIEAGWVQDLERSDSLGRLRAGTRLTGSLRLTVGADVILGEDPQSLPDQLNPFWIYSVNDRLSATFTYGF
jgi:hypothetical protein